MVCATPEARPDVCKVWLVTGATAGLGLELTRNVLARGDKVIATGRSDSQFNELLSDASIDQTRLRTSTLDVTVPFDDIKRQVDTAIDAWGRIDVLVNNAGICYLGATEEIGAEGMMHMMQTNFVGVLNVTNAVLPHMRSRREGSIVFMGSRSAFRNQIEGLGPYAASKAALHSYAETLSVEMESFDINVLIVIPGIFRTKMNSQRRAGAPLPGYETVHAGVDAMIKSVATVPKSDPKLGMDVLVDVVRGEGRAAGRRSLPLWLFLGEDCMHDVRARLDHMGSIMDEWGFVGTRLGLPEAAQ
ncbi:NAD-P-binding protein [Lactarius akahatsu]|uniref:NAD-P-binding protein n=1 Tax=Lactarius akahatsu TaxID=416441 RepID=A0AAD4LQD7_9AGAM|nr:NAD-P-binding protein [Lactarius akahatsu]